jgi:hypothetical protein
MNTKAATATEESQQRCAILWGVSVSHKCVQRLMQEMGLRALIRAKKRSRYVPGITDVHVPNVLKGDSCPKAPNEKWARTSPSCVFRRSVTGGFGIVTGDFGNVTGNSGDVTEEVSSHI